MMRWPWQRKSMSSRLVDDGYGGLELKLQAMGFRTASSPEPDRTRLATSYAVIWARDSTHWKQPADLFKVRSEAEAFFEQITGPEPPLEQRPVKAMLLVEGDTKECAEEYDGRFIFIPVNPATGNYAFNLIGPPNIHYPIRYWPSAEAVFGEDSNQQTSDLSFIGAQPDFSVPERDHGKAEEPCKD